MTFRLVGPGIGAEPIISVATTFGHAAMLKGIGALITRQEIHDRHAEPLRDQIQIVQVDGLSAS